MDQEANEADRKLENEDVLSPTKREIFVNPETTRLKIRLTEDGRIMASKDDDQPINLISVKRDTGDQPPTRLEENIEMPINAVTIASDGQAANGYTLIRVSEMLGNATSFYRVVKLPLKEDAYAVEMLSESSPKYAYKSASSGQFVPLTKEQHETMALNWLNAEAARRNILNRPIIETLGRADYSYISDGNNFFSERGIRGEEVEALIAESAILRLKGFDALALIHPDYLSVTRRQLYVKVLEKTLRHCRENGIPVFVYHYPERPVQGGFRDEYWEGTHSLPFSDEGEENMQSEVDYIARQLGKNPHEIRLAFGGMVRDWCIRQWRDCWCGKVFPEYNLPRSPVNKPFAYGETFPELSVDSLL
jgi:hypothetical protein